MQSRKICFISLENEARDYFKAELAGQDLSFADNLEAVPEEAEILSIFVDVQIDEAFLQSRPRVKLIATRSTGCDHVDLEACRGHGVAVVNVGNYGENTVAEHTFALILALSRQLRESEQAIRAGHFTREALRGFDLRGKTLGVVGAGRVGLHVIRIGIGFGMRVIAYDADPHPFYSELLDFKYVSFEELMRQSHVITMHVPLNDKTRHIINRESLAQCQEGILLINTARGGLIDSQAVVAALDSGQLGGLGLDVIEDERLFQGGAAHILSEKIAERVRNTNGPVGKEAPAARLAEFSRLVAHSQLLQRPEVVLTPHVAYNSVEATERLQSITLENIKNYLENKTLRHRCV